MDERNTPLRREVERTIGRVRDQMWELAKGQAEIQKGPGADKPVDTILRELARLQRMMRSTPEPPRAAPRMLTNDGTGPVNYSLREVAVSRIVAEIMSTDVDVRAFREDPTHRLHNWPLGWSDVQTWIESWEVEGVPPTRYLDRVPIPQEAERDVRRFLIHGGQRSADPQTTSSADISEAQVRISMEDIKDRGHFISLFYGLPGDSEEYYVNIRDGTPLARLQELSASLAARTTWSEAQATLFVLTGLTPLITSVQSEMQQNLELPGLSRIVLSVDPSLSPREVADHFRHKRKEFYQYSHRELSDKHVQLALFAAIEAPEGPVAARMAEWNRRYPHWAYSQESNFSRDSVQAQRRLIGAALRGGRERPEPKRDAGV